MNEQIRLTPKAIRTNMGYSQSQMASEINKYVPMDERKYKERENKISKWTGLEIIAFAKVANISDIRIIKLD